jgi:septal ring factor EnvC (AmiA/AmiB activator)
MRYLIDSGLEHIVNRSSVLPSEIKQDSRDLIEDKITSPGSKRHRTSSSYFGELNSALRLSDIFLISTIVSMASSSSPPLSLEERLFELQAAMSQLKKRVKEQDAKWDKLVKELSDLREEFTEAKEEGDEFTDATEVQFKDQANTNGDFGNRLCTLEIKLKRLARSQVLPKTHDD